MINVLLVDDHELVRAGLRKILNEVAGIKIVGEANTGEEALKISRKLHPQVVIMDVKMPGIGGFETTRKLLRVDPDIKILVLTTCNNDLYPTRLLKLGAAGYITKGASTAEMVQAIRAVHAGQRFLSPEIANRLVMQQGAAEQESPFESLSKRENQVMLLITQGMKVQDIAVTLSLSAKTVNSYRYRIFDKLRVKSDVDLTLLAMRHGIIESDLER